MGRVADRVMAAVAAEVRGRTEWDEAPGLYFMYLSGGGCVLRPLPVPDGIWARDRPPRVLSAMASGLGDFSGLLQRVAPEGLHGAAFRCEAWCVTGGKPGSARAAEVTAASRARLLHLHPDRVEARNMFAVDRAGITYSAMQARGDAEVRTQVHYPRPGGPAITGTIPAALDRLVTALLGVSIPARPAP
jgi:hypothetical protein